MILQLNQWPYTKEVLSVLYQLLPENFMKYCFYSMLPVHFLFLSILVLFLHFQMLCNAASLYCVRYRLRFLSLWSFFFFIDIISLPFLHFIESIRTKVVKCNAEYPISRIFFSDFFLQIADPVRLF